MELTIRIKQETIQLLKEVDFLKQENVEKTLEEPPQENFGDLASSIAFEIVKKLKKPPTIIAEEIASQVKTPKDSLIKKVEAKAGYVNFFLDYRKIFEILLKEIDEKYGQSTLGKSKKVSIEFPSVNPGKPWHIGHSRNAIIGDALQRILKFSGFIVESQDYIDDLGLQVAQVIWGIQNIPDAELPKKMGLLKKKDQWQGRLYVKVANLFAQDQKVEKEVREIMKKIEEGDLRIQSVHKKIIQDSLEGQYQTAFRLGIYHDLQVHESDLVLSGLFKKAYDKITKNENITKEKSGPNKGCLVAKLEQLEEFKGMKAADKVLIRSDGTSTYTGKDIAYHMWKFGIVEDPMKYKLWMVQPNGQEVWTTCQDGEKSDNFAKADIVVNIIGSEQNYTQKVVRYVLKLMGYEKEFDNYIHVGYEHLWFKELGEEQKFSGRKGNWIGYSTDEVLDQLVKIALKEVRKRNPDLPKQKQAEVAEKIGTGALRYVMLSTDWQKKVAFNYDEVMSFEGDTGPYLQYAHVRASKILEKAGEWKPSFEAKELEKSERELVGKLLDFPEIVGKATKDYKPHYICNYAYELAETFNTFYHSCPVIQSKGDLRNFRLTLVKAVKITLKNCLNLLGIETPEIM